MFAIAVKGLSAWQGKVIDLPKQIRFATMQAINDTAKVVQQHEVEKVLPGAFTLRGSGWWRPGTRFGVNIRPFATKASLRAVVGSQADWLRLQEEGGIKTAQGHRLAVEAGARPSQTAVLPRSLKPAALLKRAGDVRLTKTGKSRTIRKGGKGFIINTKSGPAIFIREGDALRLMYMLEPSARVPAILHFFASGAVKVQEVYQSIFDQRLQQAIATAR